MLAWLHDLICASIACMSAVSAAGDRMTLGDMAVPTSRSEQLSCQNRTMQQVIDKPLQHREAPGLWCQPSPAWTMPQVGR